MWRFRLFPILFVPLLFTSCSRNASGEISFRPPLSTTVEKGVVSLRAESLPYVEVARVYPRSDSAVVRAPARVSFRDGALSPVGAPIAGRVVEVHVKVNDRVRPGDPLVTLKSPEAAAARSALATAIARHEAAALTAKRQATMMTAGVGIESER